MTNSHLDTDSLHRHFKYLLTLIIIEGFTALISLFLISADPENSFFLGFSAKRLSLAGVNLLAVVFFVTILFFTINQSQMILRLYKLLISTPALFTMISLLFISGIFLIISFMPLSPIYQAYTERIRPIILWIFIICIQTLLLLKYHGKKEINDNIHQSLDDMKSKKNKIYRWIFVLRIIFEKPAINILCLLLITAPLLLQNTWKHAYPVGVSGLYALMAERIVQADFILPYDIPYYGPGGIPFAYPPFSFYVMATFTGLLGVDPFIYMRFAAPLLCLLCLIPMYLLTRQITGCNITATLSSLLLATYSRIYLIHGQAAGLTRALAFMTALFGIYFFYRSIDQKKWRGVFIASVFFGLTILSHPTYVELFVISAAVFVLVGTRSKQTTFFHRFKMGIVLAVGGIILSSPWWLTAYLRFGSNIFLFATESHDSLNFVNLFQNPSQFTPLLSDFMYKLYKSPLLASAATLAFFWLFVKNDILLPLWSLLYIFIFGGYDFLIITTAGIMAACLLKEIYHSIEKEKKIQHPEYQSLAAPLFLFLILGLNYYIAYNEIGSHRPVISEHTLELSDWFQKETDESATFVRLTATTEEAEWYPYLLRRTPAISSWGAEWTGDYKRQYKAVNRLISCTSSQSMECVLSTLQDLEVDPEFIIIDAGDDGLNNAFDQDKNWFLSYQNSGYKVWQNN